MKDSSNAAACCCCCETTCIHAARTYARIAVRGGVNDGDNNTIDGAAIAATATAAAYAGRWLTLERTFGLRVFVT